MWVVMGRMQDDYTGLGYSKVVATFDKNDLAREYFEKSLLKNPSTGKKFKKKSLLHGYDEGWVDYVEDAPHNPTM